MRIKLEKTIRVLQILGIVANGGVEAVIMNYYRNIDKRKIQFDFVVHNDADENYIKEILLMGQKFIKLLHIIKTFLNLCMKYITL